MSFAHFTFPEPLRSGNHIGITSPSGGVAPPLHPRLDLVLQDLRQLGILFYFENCECSPTHFDCMLQNMRQAGWFESVNGLFIGRSRGPDAADMNDLTYVKALPGTLRQTFLS